MFPYDVIAADNRELLTGIMQIHHNSTNQHQHININITTFSRVELSYKNRSCESLSQCKASSLCNLPRAGRYEVAMETSVIKHRESTRHPRLCAVRAAARVTASIQTNSCFWPRRLEKNQSAPWHRGRGESAKNE